MVRNLGTLPAQGNCQSPSSHWQTLNMVKSLSQRWGNRSWVTINHNGNHHKTETPWLPKRRSSQCWWQWLTHSPPAFPRAENLLKLLQPSSQMTRCRPQINSFNSITKWAGEMLLSWKGTKGEVLQLFEFVKPFQYPPKKHSFICRMICNDSCSQHNPV